MFSSEIWWTIIYFFIGLPIGYSATIAIRAFNRMDHQQRKMVITMLLLMVLLVMLIFGPMFSIWSLNILFPNLKIPLNFKTWCAAFWIIAMINGIRITFNKQS